MHDVLDIIKNVQTLYGVGPTLGILKDFERVIDSLGLYVFENWSEGELAAGPKIERHWVTCSFMWPRKDMPDPAGGKILLDYGCKINFEKTHIIKARQIRKPGDIRPGTKKGKLDKVPVWVVEIKMPKSLILDIYSGDKDLYDKEEQPSAETVQPAPTQEEVPGAV